jgi:hypothetical protein
LVVHLVLGLLELLSLLLIPDLGCGLVKPQLQDATVGGCVFDLLGFGQLS